MRPNEGHSHPGGRIRRKKQLRAQKECDRARGTHKLEKGQVRTRKEATEGGALTS